MKKVISWALFVLAILFFLFDVYFAVEGTIEVDLQFDKIEEMGGSGVDFLGVGVEILAMGIAFFTFVGLIFSALSVKFAQNRVIKITSLVLVLLFIFVPSFSYVFYLFIA
jgi:hypothetical protein